MILFPKDYEAKTKKSDIAATAKLFQNRRTEWVSQLGFADQRSSAVGQLDQLRKRVDLQLHHPCGFVRTDAQNSKTWMNG